MNTGKTLLLLRAAAFFGAIGACAWVAPAGPGGSGPACWVAKPNGSACDFWIDAQPACPDVFHGGGACGVQGAETGYGMVYVQADCVVTIRSVNAYGNCYEVSTGTQTVSCPQPTGTACP